MMPESSHPFREIEIKIEREWVYIHERIFCHGTYKNTYIVFDWVMVQD
jgi:hypothetical protein